MGQIAVNLPVPAFNGEGAAVDVSSFGPLKTIVVSGGADAIIVIQMSNDPGGTNWPPLAVFQQSGTQSTSVAARWLRAVTQQYRSGTPACDVGGTNEGSSFVQLPVPVGNGTGAPVDVSAMGVFKTPFVGGDFRGALNIEISEDGTNWATAFSFNNPGQISNSFAAQFMRVRRNGVPEINPGLPDVYLGATDQTPGDRGVAISAGTQSVGTGTVAFANSNGLSFGMSDSSQVTASMDAFRSIIGAGSTATGPTFSFLNTN